MKGLLLNVLFNWFFREYKKVGLLNFYTHLNSQNKVKRHVFIAH